VIDRLVELAKDEDIFARATIETAFVVDESMALELYKQLSSKGRMDHGPCILNIDGVYNGDFPRSPRYYDYVANHNVSRSFDDEVASEFINYLQSRLSEGFLKHLNSDVSLPLVTGIDIEKEADTQPSEVIESDNQIDNFRFDLNENEKYVSHIADSSIPTEYEPGSDLAKYYDNDRRLLQRRRNEQILCSRGGWWGHDAKPEGLTIQEAAKEFGFNGSELSSEAPEDICTFCWKELLDNISKIKQRKESDQDYDETGFRMRWKQKGNARKVWRDIVVTPETTFEELDNILCPTFGIDSLHVRMYGLEDEYEDSSLGILPHEQHSKTGMVSGKDAENITISDVASKYSLWVDDRLSLVYDLGTPSEFYYCIIKETLSRNEIDEIKANNETSIETRTAFSLKRN
jgi:hypothetical protein